jgi:hypothetical protein
MLYGKTWSVQPRNLNEQQIMRGFNTPPTNAINLNRYQATLTCLPQYIPLFGEERKYVVDNTAQSAIGVSSVRLLPKKTGLRAIANLSKRRRKLK